MSIISGTSHSSGDFYDYPIEQSLRFDGTSSYLSKSITASQSAWSFSVWVKRSTISVTGYDPIIADNVANDDGLLAFESIGLLMFLDKWYNGSTGLTNYKRTTSVYRDTSAWYHIFIAYDASASNVDGALKMEINGIEPPSTTGADQYPRNSLGWWDGSMFIGRVSSDYFSGYLANIQFIDGQALTAASFGETKSGVWIPKAYTSSYGTNGFRLAFNLSDFNTSGSAVSDPYGSATNLPDGYVADASGSGNHWQVN